jgi:hypothetical protein
VVAVFGSFCLFFLLPQADAAIGGKDPAVVNLAETVWKDIKSHKDNGDDINKIAYLYIHYKDDLKKPDYTNEDVKELFAGKKKIRKLKGNDTPYFPGPTDFESNDSNLMVGTIPTLPDGLPKLKKILDPLTLINTPAKCPKLVIFGRTKYQNKIFDLEGWPQGDDGLFERKKAVDKVCGPAVEFYYHIHEKPKAETVLALFADNHVNIDFQSNH